MDIIEIRDDRHARSLPSVFHDLRHKGSRTTMPGRFLAEGARVVRRALRSPVTIPSLAVTPPWFEALRDDIGHRREQPAAVYLVEKKHLDALVGFRLRQGILAEIEQPVCPPEELWIAGLPENHFLVALDGLSDAENVGAVVRNAAAFGLDGLIVDHRTADPFLRRAVRVSMGGVFFLPVYRSVRLSSTLARLRDRRRTGIVAATAAPGVTAGVGGPRRPCCLVLGSEGDGLSPEALRVCDGAIHIPMARDGMSLNVAAASAVLFERVRAEDTRCRTHGTIERTDGP